MPLDQRVPHVWGRDFELPVRMYVGPLFSHPPPQKPAQELDGRPTYGSRPPQKKFHHHDHDHDRRHGVESGRVRLQCHRVQINRGVPRHWETGGDGDVHGDDKFWGGVGGERGDGGGLRVFEEEEG